MLITQPPFASIVARQASWAQTSAPRTFTRKVLSQASRSASIVRPMTGLVAALLISTSMPPSRSIVAATHASAWSGSPALAANVARRAPGTSASIPCAASSSASCFRDDSITAAPSRAYAVAMPSPIPFDAPVIERDLAVEHSHVRLRIGLAISGLESHAPRRSVPVNP